MRDSVHERGEMRGQQQVSVSTGSGRRSLRDRTPPAVDVQTELPSRQVSAEEHVSVSRRMVRSGMQST